MDLSRHKPASTSAGGGVVLHGSRCGAVTPYRSRSACLLFVVYDREATRINGNQEWLISNVIACRADNYGIASQAPRTVGH